MQEYLQKYHSTDDNYFLKIIHQKKHPFTYPKLAEEKADALKEELYINRGKQSLNFEIFWKKKKKKKNYWIRLSYDMKNYADPGGT